MALVALVVALDLYLHARHRHWLREAQQGAPGAALQVCLTHSYLIGGGDVRGALNCRWPKNPPARPDSTPTETR